MYEFKVTGMTCPSCARGIRNALSSIDANAEVKVDIDQQKVTVRAKGSLREIGRLIELAGYPVIEEKRIA